VQLVAFRNGSAPEKSRKKLNGLGWNNGDKKVTKFKTSNHVLYLAGPRLVGAPLHRCALMEKNVKVPSGLS
jgi:hypothetical protein